MNNQLVLTLDGKLRDVVMRGLRWYKHGLGGMWKVISNFIDARAVEEEIESVTQVINQLEKQTYRSLPMQTVLNQSCNKALVKKTLLDLQANPDSVVMGWMSEDHWLEIKFVPHKGYELRIQGEVVDETPDLEEITESFATWGKRRKIDLKQKTY